MNFDEYFESASKLFLQACETYCLAECTYKSLYPDRQTSGEAKYPEAPYLENISTGNIVWDKKGFQMQPDEYLSKEIGLRFGDKMIDDGINIEEIMNTGGRVHENFIATQIVISQFSLLEHFELNMVEEYIKRNLAKISTKQNKYTLKDLINKNVDQLKAGAIAEYLSKYKSQPVKKRLRESLRSIDIEIPKECIDNYEYVNEIRVHSAHNHDPTGMTMKNSLEYFVCTIEAGKYLGISFNDDSAKNHIWPDFEKHI